MAKAKAIVGIPKNDIEKMSAEDRRFLMNVLNQNVQILQSMSQFKMNLFMAYVAVYLSLIAILISIQKSYLIIPITIIFAITAWRLLQFYENKLIRLQTKTYMQIKAIHFNYLLKGVKKSKITEKSEQEWLNELLK